jgi:hypothetical protein
LQALHVIAEILTIWWPPEDLIKEKSDSRLSAKSSCQPSRNLGYSCDLRLSLPAQLGSQLNPRYGMQLTKADDLLSIQ